MKTLIIKTMKTLIIKPLTLCLGLLLLSGCKNQSTSEPSTTPQGSWIVAELNTQSATQAHPTNVISLNIRDKGYAGYGGCNDYGGDVLFDEKGAIRFTSPQHSLMACENSPMEEAFWATLPKVMRYQITEKPRQLLLVDAEGKVLVRLDQASSQNP